MLVPTQSTSQVSTLNVIDELLISKEISKKMWGTNHPHGAGISSIAERLHDTEAEYAVIASLCHGVLLDGPTTLEALKAPMTAQGDTQFRVEEGSQKYRGLLSGEQELFGCQLCLEQDALDFKDTPHDER